MNLIDKKLDEKYGIEYVGTMSNAQNDLISDDDEVL